MAGRGLSNDLVGLQPTKTRVELDSSMVLYYLRQIFYEYHPLIMTLTIRPGIIKVIKVALKSVGIKIKNYNTIQDKY